MFNDHTNYVLCLAVLPDNTLASSSYDQTIKIWDIGSGKELKSLDGHTDKVKCLAVLSDNTLRVQKMKNKIKEMIKN